VLNSLLSGQRFSGQIEEQTGMYKSHVSRTLKELTQMKLITCSNPKDRSYKFYKITPTGKELALQANKLLISKRKDSVKK